ncbi:MAG: hypothetical protein ACYTFI_05935, partial [Planctomycetota bacterium]
MGAELNRREFLTGTAVVAGGIGLAAYGTAARAAGRTNMCGFAAKPMDKVRIGIIGLGARGPGAVNRMSKIADVEIVALCDLFENRVEKGQRILAKHGRPRARGFHGNEQAWEKLCDLDLDLVYIATPWRWHTPMAV